MGVRHRVERAGVARLNWSIAAIVVVVFTGLIAHGNYDASGDPVHYMIIARSLAFDRDVDLGNDYSDPANIITEPAGAHALPGRNGILRPVHDIGLPLAFAPFFAVAYRLAGLSGRLPQTVRDRGRISPFIALRQIVSMQMIFITAALAVLMFHVAWRLSGEKAISFFWALAWTLSPPILSHGHVFFTEVPSALIALFVYAHLDDAVKGDKRVRGFLLGALAGYLAIIHVRNVGIILALMVLATWHTRARLRNTVWFGAGILLMAAVKVAINDHFWGTLMTAPHEQLGPWLGINAALSEMTVRGAGCSSTRDTACSGPHPSICSCPQGGLRFVDAHRTSAGSSCSSARPSSCSCWPRSRTSMDGVGAGRRRRVFLCRSRHSWPSPCRWSSPAAARRQRRHTSCFSFNWPSTYFSGATRCCSGAKDPGRRRSSREWPEPRSRAECQSGRRSADRRCCSGWSSSADGWR